MTAPVPTVRHFCTYFDRNYLSRGLALYRSLAVHCPEFRLYVLSLDEATHAYLQRAALPGLVSVSVHDLEAHDADLASAKPTRSIVEYYFTATSCWVKYVFQRFADVDLVTYLDADFWFFSSPEPLFTELGMRSIAVVEHRFAPEREAEMAPHGRFNVGWLSFRRTDVGLACVSWWRERCIEWCYDRIEDGKYADQKYLDEWPARFPDLAILQHKGVSVAPWNLETVRIAVDGSVPLVDQQPLICFHFHGLKHVLGPFYESGLRPFRAKLTPSLRQWVYGPYFEQLLGIEAELATEGLGTGRAKSLRLKRGGFAGLVQRATVLVTTARLIASGKALVGRRPSTTARRTG
jgi:hypothetical protein